MQRNAEFEVMRKGVKEALKAMQWRTDAFFQFKSMIAESYIDCTSQ